MNKSNILLSKLIKTQYSLILRQFFLNFAISLSDYLGSILSFIAIAVPLFAGWYNNMSAADLSRLISQNSFVTIYLINCFTRLIDLASNFSIFLGTSRRIMELFEWLQQNNCNESLKFNGVNTGETYQNMCPQQEMTDYFQLNNLSIRTPISKRIIVEKLNLSIRAGCNLIITGDSGVGKSSVLRAIKNIWNINGGHVKRNLLIDNPKSVMFLPQKSLLTTGCLAEVQIFIKKESFLNYNPSDDCLSRYIHH